MLKQMALRKFPEWCRLALNDREGSTNHVG